MRNSKIYRRVVPLAGAVCVLGLTGLTDAAISVDGSLDSDYGSPLATQTVNTGFGDNTDGSGASSGGSELDAAYGVVESGNLYLLFTGNFQAGTSPAHVNIFIDDGRAGGQNILNANASAGSLSAANGLTFPTGFNATYAIDGNDYSNTFYFDQYDLINNLANYIGSVTLTGGIGNGALTSGVFAGINNTNTAGVNSNTSVAASASAADAVTTGLEFEIPLADLGSPTGPIEVLADINNNSDNYLSNQFLPGLPVGYGNLATASSVNLATDGANITPISVAVPEPTSLFAIAAGGLLLVRRRSHCNRVV